MLPRGHHRHLHASTFLETRNCGAESGTWHIFWQDRDFTRLRRPAGAGSAPCRVQLLVHSLWRTGLPGQLAPREDERG